MKIILADDHAMFRDGLRHLLAHLDEAGLQLLEAESHDATLQLLKDHPDTDLVLLDLHMPGRKDNIPALAEVLASAGAIPVVVLSASEDLEEVHQVIRSGAMGFIPKHEHSDVMLCALQLVLSGGVYIPTMAISQTASPVLCRLTPKQLEVLKLLCKGYSNKEIGTFMNISEATVKCHVTSVLRELDATSRSQAVTIARQRELIPRISSDSGAI